MASVRRKKPCTLAGTIRAFKKRKHVEAAVIPRGRDVSTTPGVVLRPFSVKRTTPTEKMNVN